jgi:hypothetical protein
VRRAASATPAAASTKAITCAMDRNSQELTEFIQLQDTGKKSTITAKNAGLLFLCFAISSMISCLSTGLIGLADASSGP